MAQQLTRDPFSGQVFAFRGRRCHLIKLLFWDGQGLVLYAKRLERGHFVWPATGEGAVSLTPAQLSMLTEGIDWRAPTRTWQPEMAGWAVSGCWFCLVRRGHVTESPPMAIIPAELPSDVAALQAMVAAQAAELATQNATLAARDAELAAARAGIVEQRFEIEALKARLARALRIAFSRSSEKLRDRIEQLELTLADIDELLAETAPSNDPGIVPEAPIEASKPVRRPLPEVLPRDVVEHAAPCHDKTGACLACGGTLRRLGEDVTEILDYVPGSFRVIRHVRPKLSCRSCETITQAPAASLPIRRGRAGPGLLAHVLVAKYCDHLPLHRQAEIYIREDVDLSRSTLADMIADSDDGGQRFRLKPSSDSDPRRTGIPIDPGQGRHRHGYGVRRRLRRQA